MRIAVNTRLLLKGKLEGIGWVAYESLKRITQNHPEHEFIFIFDRPYSSEFIFADNITPVVAYPQSRHPILWYLFFEWTIPHILKKYKADIFLSPDGWTSLRTNVPTLNVIHDLNFEHFPEFIEKKWVRKYCTYYPRRYAQKAQRIATVSEFSKQDIIQTYGIDADKIDVVYNGYNADYHPVSEEKQQETRNRISEGKPYFIFVGSIHQRKNISNLFRAFDSFKQNDTTQTKLVIVGTKMWKAQEITDTYESMQYKQDVIFIGRLNPMELQDIMASAWALVFASLFEGFGIPILEAFSTGIPVITSNVTSMPEIAKDAALLVDPYSVDEISQAMQQIVSNPELRKDLIDKGNIRKNDFSWDAAALKLWQCIEKMNIKDKQ